MGLGGRGVRWAEGGAEEWSAVTFNVMPRLSGVEREEAWKGALKR